MVELYKTLVERREFVMSKQLLRSRTSVGVMVREAERAQSKADFIHKLAIVQKEMNESIYWLELLYTTKYITDVEFKNFEKGAIEVMKIITSIIKSTKLSLKK